MLRRTKSRNIFSWASASGTWRLPRTKNIFSRPTAYRTTSPSSTSQISKSSRRSRSASFLGVSLSHSSDSFGVRFTPVGETTRFAFSAWEPTRRRAPAMLDTAGPKQGTPAAAIRATDGTGVTSVGGRPEEPDVGMMDEMTPVDAPAVALEGVDHFYGRRRSLAHATYL